MLISLTAYKTTLSIPSFCVSDAASPSFYIRQQITVAVFTFSLLSFSLTPPCHSIGAV